MTKKRVIINLMNIHEYLKHKIHLLVVYQLINWFISDLELSGFT